MELAAIIIALIVPIGIAIWTVRSSAKDTAKQIAALEESTTKQIESIKEQQSVGQVLGYDGCYDSGTCPSD